MLRKALMAALLMSCAPALAQTNWELRVMAGADLQTIHEAYAAGEFSQQRLQEFVDTEYRRFARVCPRGVGSCDSRRLERRQIDMLELYLAAYVR